MRHVSDAVLRTGLLKHINVFEVEFWEANVHALVSLVTKAQSNFRVSGILGFSSKLASAIGCQVPCSGQYIRRDRVLLHPIPGERDIRNAYMDPRADWEHAAAAKKVANWSGWPAESPLVRLQRPLMLISICSLKKRRIAANPEGWEFTAYAQSRPKTYRKWPGSERCQNWVENVHFLRRFIIKVATFCDTHALWYVVQKIALVWPGSHVLLKGCFVLSFA